MTPARLAKIRALAADVRGNPYIRAVAQRMLEKHGGAERWKPPPDPPNPGLKTSEEFDKFVFMNLDTWDETVNGNYRTNIKWQGRAYRFILFRHKKTPTWGWLRADIANNTESWSRNKYATLEEAHQSAWLHLTLI